MARLGSERLSVRLEFEPDPSDSLVGEEQFRESVSSLGCKRSPAMEFVYGLDEAWVIPPDLVAYVFGGQYYLAAPDPVVGFEQAADQAFEASPFTFAIPTYTQVQEAAAHWVDAAGSDRPKACISCLEDRLSSRAPSEWDPKTVNYSIIYVGEYLRGARDREWQLIDAGWGSSKRTAIVGSRGCRLPGREIVKWLVQPSGLSMAEKAELHWLFPW